MGTPTLKLIFDRRHRASNTKEGAIELRITYNRIQKHATTGVRVLPKQWKNGHIVNRLDASELQYTLDLFVARCRKVINEHMAAGTLDMQTIVADIGGRQHEKATEHVHNQRKLLPFFQERAVIRKYGRVEDSQERYDRFLRWFERWGGMETFDDLTEANVLRMDAELQSKGMKASSIWNNYHRFLNSFILDAMDEGLIRRNPYKSLHIDKAKRSDGLSKYLTKEEFARIAEMPLPVDYLRHARDLFVFQTYTCLAYVDMAAFDPAKIREVNGRKVYVGKRGKTNQEFVFLLLPPALKVLEDYGGRLPIMSNQVYNKFIKMIAVMAGIEKPVSSHWARHTGATLLLNSGVDMEVVSKVLGHSSTKMTRQVYAKLLDETVVDAMAKVEARLQ